MKALRPPVLLGIAMLVTVAAYWTGLSGPFLFDDRSNFAVLQRWLSDEVTWREVVLGHGSLLYTRPVAMASFLLNVAIGGGDAFGFKLGNLIVHLLCGLCAWQLLRHMLAADKALSANAELIAAIVASLWLLHPLHASTVLYAVQRMTQLSTLFTLAALWVYIIARRQLIDGRTLVAAFNLFGLFPLLVMAGFFSKQNAVVAPVLCLVMELAYFQNRPRPGRLLQGFFALFLGLPVAAGIALLLFAPQRLLGDYALYDFTLGQRLLTEPRVLMDYIGHLLVPRGPQMGLYTDDFTTSTGLFSPPATLFSILALTGISVLAVALRNRAPSLFAGWCFFLVAHSVESSLLPLDLYFEHRNYLPAVGLLLAIAGLLALVARQIATNVLTPRQLGLLTAGGLAVVFAFGTHARALVWQDKYSIARQGIQQHPHSLRAALDLAAIAYDRGRNDEHDAVLSKLTHSNVARHRMMAHIYQVSIACVRRVGGDPALLARAVEDASPIVTLAELHAFSVLSNAANERGCGQVTDELIADSIVKVLIAASTQSDQAQPKWLLRFTAANLYIRAGLLEKAQQQAELAWQPGADPAIGALLAELYARNGMLSEAKETLAEATRRIKPHSDSDRAAIAKIRAWIYSLPGS